MSQPHFLIADVKVINEAKYEGYRMQMVAAITAFGGRLLARGQEPKVIEGGWSPQRMFLAEFPETVAAQEFPASSLYRAAAELAHNCAMVDMVLVAGLKASRHASATHRPAYAVADTKVINRQRFTELSPMINQEIHRYHGRHLAWSDHAQTVEGNWAPALLTVLEFPDYQETLTNYASVEYRNTHEVLSNAAMIDLVLLRGIGSDGADGADGTSGA